MELHENGRLLNIGVVGFGNRALEQVRLLKTMQDIRILAVCDKYEDRAKAAGEFVPGAAWSTDYRDMLKMDEIEAVIIITDWLTHIPIAIDAMKAGKHVAMVVGGAPSIEDCWKLIRAAEETSRTCMLLENCCYGEVELAMLNMINKGVFGELLQCQGAYAHDLREEIGNGDVNRHYRQDNFLHRNGELYPTHELGPIARYLKLNRGNRMVSLCSMATASKGLNTWFKEHRPDSDLCNAQVNEGDIVTTMIKCADGQTIILSHDCTLPRPYSRGGIIRGTRGVWQEDNHSICIEGETPKAVDPDLSHLWKKDHVAEHAWEPEGPWIKAFRHPLWAAYEEFGTRGGHGGMDYLVLRGFLESVQKGIPAPIDVYDSAMLMCITALSEQSIAMGSMPVPVPDFTGGKWIFPKEETDNPYDL